MKGPTEFTADKMEGEDMKAYALFLRYCSEGLGLMPLEFALKCDDSSLAPLIEECSAKFAWVRRAPKVIALRRLGRRERISAMAQEAAEAINTALIAAADRVNTAGQQKVRFADNSKENIVMPEAFDRAAETLTQLTRALTAVAKINEEKGGGINVDARSINLPGGMTDAGKLWGQPPQRSLPASKGNNV